MNLLELIVVLETVRKKLVEFEKKLITISFTLALAVLQYAFLAWIFLGIYHAYGRDYVFIALGVGVILFGLKQRTDGALRDLEIKQLRGRLDGERNKLSN
jgi:membrane protease YdiL (CAAX protease family)